MCVCVCVCAVGRLASFLLRCEGQEKATGPAKCGLVGGSKTRFGPRCPGLGRASGRRYRPIGSWAMTEVGSLPFITRVRRHTICTSIPCAESDTRVMMWHVQPRVGMRARERETRCSGGGEGEDGWLPKACQRLGTALGFFPILRA